MRTKLQNFYGRGSQLSIFIHNVRNISLLPCHINKIFLLLVQTVSTDSQYRQSVQTVSADSQCRQSVQTVSADSQYRQSVQTVSTDSQYRMWLTIKADFHRAVLKCDVLQFTTRKSAASSQVHVEPEWDFNNILLVKLTDGHDDGLADVHLVDICCVLMNWISVCVLPKPVYSSQTLTGSEGVLEILTLGAILIRVYKMSICWMKSNDSSTL